MFQALRKGKERLLREAFQHLSRLNGRIRSLFKNILVSLLRVLRIFQSFSYTLRDYPYLA